MLRRVLHNEHELVARCAAGEVRPFNQLAKRYENPLWFFFFKYTKDKEDSKDLVQETLIKSFQMLQGGKYDSSKGAFSTWIYKVGYNLMIDARRKGRRSNGRKKMALISLDAPLANHQEEEEKRTLLNKISTEIDSPTHELFKREMDFDPQPLIERLPSTERLIVTLRYFQGFSYAEIASFMDSPLGTIKGTLHRAHARLLEMAQDLHIESMTERVQE